MSTVKALALLVLAFLCTVGTVLAVSGASLDRGKTLFNDTKLGTNGKACATCHAGGQNLPHLSEVDDVAGTINGCINGMLKGKSLDSSSVDMQSLVLYVKSLGADKPAATK